MPGERVTVSIIVNWQGMPIGRAAVDTTLDRLGTPEERMPIESMMVNSKRAMRDYLDSNRPC